MRFFSAASRLGSLLGLPSPTRTTPGLPTARWTTSMFLFAATAGVTVQPPRMLCKIAAAVPGWPSIVAYWADWVNRPNMISAPSSPLMMPSGSSQKIRPVINPTITNTARMPTPTSASMGSAQGLALRTMPAAMRSCLMRPRLAGSGGAAGLFTMDGRIREPGVRVKLARGLSLPASQSLGVQPARPVGRADQRAGHHPGEAQADGLLAPVLELIRRHPAGHRVMPGRRPQVLGDREQFTARPAQVGHGLADLPVLLAKAEYQVGLGDQPSLPGLGQYLQRPLITEPGPDLPEDPGDRLDVV